MDFSFLEHLPRGSALVFIGILCYAFAAQGGLRQREISERSKKLFWILGSIVIITGLISVFVSPSPGTIVATSNIPAVSKGSNISNSPLQIAVQLILVMIVLMGPLGLIFLLIPVFLERRLTKTQIKSIKNFGWAFIIIWIFVIPQM